MVWLAYNGVVTITLSEYRALSGRDRLLLHLATNQHIEDINEKGGGTISGAPPRRDR